MTDSVQSPQEYLDIALDYIQTRAFNASHFPDWDTLRRECHERIASAQTTADTYPVIEDVLSRLEDGHSFLRTPQRVQEVYSPETPFQPLPSGRRLESDIGYLEITGVRVESTFEAYIAAVYEVIQASSAPPVKGWIIDVRRNPGGNMYPMLAAIGEILGEATLGTFISAQNEIVTWSYRADGSYYGDELVQRVQKPTFGVDHTQLPAAVLVSAQTKSAGEMVVIAFIGREPVRLFGEATAGRTNANSAWFLSDGAQLALAMQVVKDRTGKLYEGAIIPDEIVTVDWERFGEDDDPAIMAALRWLATLCPNMRSILYKDVVGLLESSS